MTDVRIINPLGGALGHYTRELATTLTDLGCEVQTESVAEPSARGGRRGRRIAWMVEYLRAVRGRGEAPDVLVCVWPALGYVDLVLLRLSRASRKVLIVHDPEPLVRAVGYGKPARWLARRLGRPTELLVHGSSALRVVIDRHRMRRVVRVCHPMLEPRASSIPAGAEDSGGQATIRVLGQFKSGRSLGALAEIAESGDPRWKREIVGRGWPPVPGWRVRSEFVPESEFENLIATADVVVVPYDRFFQSGVAIRALELLTPVVVPENEAMLDLLGEDCSWIARSDWAAATLAAVTASPREVTRRSGEASREARRSWESWLGVPQE